MECVTSEILERIEKYLQIILRIMRYKINFLLQSIFSSGKKLDIIKYQIYFQQHSMKFKRKGGKQRKKSKTYLIWWRIIWRITQEILWNNILGYDKYQLIQCGKIPAYPMMDLLIIFITVGLHQLSVCGLCQERVTPFTKSEIYLYYLLSRKHIRFFKRKC